MKPNDDVIGQKIIRIANTRHVLSLYLSNGMIIKGVAPNTEVDDAGAIYPLRRWVNINEGKLLRTRGAA